MEIYKCEKITYETYLEAQKVISTARKGRRKNRKRATKSPKRAYKCEYCGKYHLTSQKKKRSLDKFN